MVGDRPVCSLFPLSYHLSSIFLQGIVRWLGLYFHFVTYSYLVWVLSSFVRQENGYSGPLNL